MCVCTNFYSKWTTLNFSAQICPKKDSGSEIQETNVGIRISIFKMPCVPVFRKNGQLWLFRPKFAQKWILGSEFKNLILDSKSASLRCYVYQSSDIRFNFQFLEPNLLKNGFWGWNFKNQDLDSELTPPIYHLCQFPVKIDNF